MNACVGDLFCALRGQQGPSQPDSASRHSYANGPFNSPGTSNPFATPASVTSHQSLEDEETLLLDPQVLHAACALSGA